MQKNQRETAGYIEVLSRFHAFLHPQSYFEIGTLSGTSLELARCASIAVDPGFKVAERDVLRGKPSCQFFQMTSDAFFANHDPSALLGRPVDMAFLDGMHYAEFLLRDFINIERHVKPNSVVMMHDCVPGDAEMTSREILQGMAWTGDVWKVVLALKKYRPDIRVRAYDAPPSGLIVCTNLNPASRTLADSYADILDDFAGWDLATIGVGAFKEMIGLAGTEQTKTFEEMSRLYWL